jgi:hypothetical protein
MKVWIHKRRKRSTPLLCPCVVCSERPTFWKTSYFWKHVTCKNCLRTQKSEKYKRAVRRSHDAKG